MNIVYNTFMTINYKPVILDNVYIYTQMSFSNELFDNGWFIDINRGLLHLTTNR